MSSEAIVKIIFAARDKASATFNRIRGGSTALARSLKGSNDELKSLNQTQKSVNAFKKTDADLKRLSQSLSDNRKKVSELKREMTAAGPPTKAQSKDLEKLLKTTKDLSSKKHELKGKLTGMSAELKKSGFNTRAMSSEQGKLSQNIKKATDQASKQEAALKKLSDGHKKYDQAKEFQGKLTSAGVKSMATGAVIGAPVLKSIYDFAAEENAFLDVVKQVDGMRDEKGGLTKFGASIRKSMHDMARKNNVNFLDVYDLFSAAGRNGLKELDELNAAALTSLHTTVALELPDAKQAGDELTKIAGLYRIKTENMMEVGDVINFLDDSTTAKGSELINVIQRAGSKADQVGFKNMAGLAATLLETANGQELSGTGIKTMVRNLSMVDEKGQGDILKKIGMSVAGVKGGMQIDGYGTFRKVLEGVANNIKEEDQMGTLVDLFGVSGGGYAETLLKNRELLDRNIGFANSPDTQGTVSKEAGIKNSALSAIYQSKFQNNLGILSAEFGQHFKPVLVDVINALGDFMEKMTSWAQQNPQTAAAIGKIVAGVSLLFIGLGGLAIAAATILGPMALMRLSFTYLTAGGGTTATVLGLLPKLFRLLTGSLMTAGRAIIFVGKAMAMTPIGRIITLITLIALAGYSIYKNWDPIKAWLGSFWEGVKAKWAPIGGWISGLWGKIKAFFSSGIVNISATILNWSPFGLFYQVFAKVLSWFGIDLPKTFTGYGSMLINGLINGVKAGWGKFKSFWNDTVNYLPDSFAKKMEIHSPSRVMKGMGGHVMSGLTLGIKNNQGALGKTFSDAIAYFDPEGNKNAISGQSARSIMPSFSGGRQMVAAGAGDTFNINISMQGEDGITASSIAQAVRNELDKMQREKARRSRSQFKDRD